MTSTEQLLRLSYVSAVDNEQRNYFVFLPRAYSDNPQKMWPVMMFLHGNGGDELDYVLSHGPLLHEAWIYKRDLPFHYYFPAVVDVRYGQARYWISRQSQSR